MRRRSQVVRQRSAKPSPAGSIPAVASNIPTPPGFSFAATVESHGWVQLEPFRWSREEGVLRRKEKLPEGIVELEIAHRDGALHVRGARDSHVLRERIARMFQLHVDLSDFFEMARKTETHAWVEQAGFGRLLCGSTLWEDAVKIICTTNTMWRQTKRMVELLVAKCGRDGAFPDQQDVARFSAEELQQDCRLGYRAKSIRALAELDLDAIEDYLDLPGIGPYGAAHLRAMEGRHEAIAVDTEFRKFVREKYHGGRKVADATLVRRYKKWGRWQYMAYWSELWESVAAGLQQPRAGGDK